MKKPEVPATQVDSDALQYILSMPAGRKVLWDILALAGLYRQPRVPQDSEGTSFNCGSLNVGLAIFADCLTVAPDLTAMMTKEQASYDNRTEPEPQSISGPRADSRSGSAAEPEPSPGLGFERVNRAERD